ncbi:MAG: TrmH family RNA methyltransferase [Phycisphaerales bacterium]
MNGGALPVTTIAADPADPRLAPYRGVRDADLRGRDGLCCIETPRVVARFLASALRARERGGEARDALPCVPRSVLCAPRGLESLADLLRRLPEVDVFLAPDDRTVTEISGYGLHSGALAIGVRRDEPVPSSLAGEDGTLAACDGVVHTDNLGAIFRNAASFGAAGVLLSPNSSDPLLRKTIRVAMGRVFDVPWARARDWPQALWDLRARHGFRIVAAEDAPGAVDVGTLSPTPRTVVVFGAEGAGVSKAILEGADAVARVPMSTRGGTLANDPPSLNVAVASAVMLDRLCAR